MQKVSVCNVNLQLIESKEHSFLMSGRDVSVGYGVSEAVIRSHKKNQADELIEGKHFVMIRTANNATKTMWTKRGVVRLGNFIKSEQGRKFRDWAEDYIINSQNSDNELKQIILQQNEQIAHLTRELSEAQKLIPEKTQMSSRSSNHLLDLIGQIARYIEESEHMEILMAKRRERVQGFMSAFVRSMNHAGITEQSQRKSEFIDWQMMKSQK